MYFNIANVLSACYITQETIGGTRYDRMRIAENHLEAP